MDFIRKNWSRLSLAFLFFIGGIMSIIAWVNFPKIPDGIPGKWMYDFRYIALLISTIVFFFGMVCVTVLKSVSDSKKIVSIVYMAMGAFVTVLLLILITVASCNQYTDMIVFYGDNAINAFYTLWVPFFVFGLHPLIKGVTRFIEAETVPAKAAVQPVVQPTAQPVTETAPKATARKAAPKTPAAK